MVDCDGCRGRYHFLCGELTRRDLKGIQTGKRIWTCNKCILRELPLNTSFVSASSRSLNLSCSDDFVEANDITDSSLNDLTDVPEIVKMRHRDSREVLVLHLNVNSLQNKFEEAQSSLNDRTDVPEIVKMRHRDSREVLVLHLNVNSLQNKFEEAQSLITDFRAQIVFLTETKIDSSYPI